MNKQALETIAQAMVATEKAFLPPMKAPAPSKSALTVSMSTRQKIIAAIIAKCFSGRMMPCASIFPA